MKIKCAITDDETYAAKGLASYAEKIEFLDLKGICHSALELNQFLLNNEVDLVFLDIQMPHLSGIDFLRSLKDPPLVVFATAFSEFAIEGYELNVIDYLLKPISFDRFLKAATKAYQYLSMKEKSTDVDTGYFFVRCENKIEKINVPDILFIESMQNYVQIFTTERKYMAHLPLKTVKNFLDSAKFIQPHQSYIVPIDKIDSIEGNALSILKYQIPISKHIREQILEKILNTRYLKK
jgi:DNA-binding LytR/AlgR family response regulator